MLYNKLTDTNQCKRKMFLKAKLNGKIELKA